MIKSGHVKPIQFELSADDLGYYDGRGEFFLDPGEFDIFVGGSSSTRLHTVIILTAEQIHSMM